MRRLRPALSPLSPLSPLPFACTVKQGIMVRMKIEIPDKKKLVYEMSIPIRWGDMDAMGHLNNGSYFRYMEIARIDWMHSLGFEPDPKGEGMVIVNAFCNFYRQIEYPGNVLLRMYVSDPGRTTFESWATMARTDAPDVICAAAPSASRRPPRSSSPRLPRR